jgi:hypothetical protein
MDETRKAALYGVFTESYDCRRQVSAGLAAKVEGRRHSGFEFGKFRDFFRIE